MAWMPRRAAGRQLLAGEPAVTSAAGSPVDGSCFEIVRTGECDSTMRVDIVDPSAYAPHYDHGLCRALVRAGADVRLVTSDFRYGPVPEVDGYELARFFYRR